MRDTYLCATNSGDITFLNWLHARLVLVYHEDENIDFVHTIDNFSSYFQRRKRVPKWLNWLLLRYRL